METNLNFNVNDIVKATVGSNIKYGVIKSILEVKDSEEEAAAGNIILKVSLLNTRKEVFFIKDTDVLQAYNMYYEYVEPEPTPEEPENPDNPENPKEPTEPTEPGDSGADSGNNEDTGDVTES